MPMYLNIAPMSSLSVWYPPSAWATPWSDVTHPAPEISKPMHSPARKAEQQTVLDTVLGASVVQGGEDCPSQSSQPRSTES